MASIKPKKTQMQTKNIAVFSCGLLTGCFLSSLLILSSSLLDNSCIESGFKVAPSVINHDDRVGYDAEHAFNRHNLGWKQINVFFGNTSHISDTSNIPVPYFNANRWFSQYRQDEIISALVHGKRNGYFVDLAANDAVRISNTYALETHFEWDGICLEPNAAYWSGLAYRKCHVVAAVVGSDPMDEVVFKFPKAKGPKGGIVGQKFDNKETNNEVEFRRRFTTPLLDILKKFDAPRVIDYMSLDVEGAEDLVMSAFPFAEYRFNLLTVERPSMTLSNILDTNGYLLLTTLKKGKETLWVHRSAKDSLDMSALEIDSQNYKYRENTDQPRTAPELSAAAK
jgi:hypothetical protein